MAWRHGGSDYGVKTQIDFCPDLNTGVVVLTNGNSIVLTQAIARTLYAFSQGLIDSDGDGVADTLDNCPHAYNPDLEDSDYDGYGDSCDVCIFDFDNDGDGDGLCAEVDNCPLTYNPLQEDADEDGYGDACDNCPYLFDAYQSPDTDADGVGDPCDNCVEVFNPGQEDINNDNIGDACCCTGMRGNADCSESDEPDISDITRLIDYLYLNHAVLCCPNEADADASGGEPDIS
ncbi:MAG: thrombospondin type 3 repeat-containing protein, partial [candidate division Zixibacteria bacterium]|nr:thrombospondin type 3 repeat-containing protein [candidate division Zixibacteria bacterium]